LSDNFGLIVLSRTAHSSYTGNGRTSTVKLFGDMGVMATDSYLLLSKVKYKTPLCLFTVTVKSGLLSWSWTSILPGVSEGGAVRFAGPGIFFNLHLIRTALASHSPSARRFGFLPHPLSLLFSHFDLAATRTCFAASVAARSAFAHLFSILAISSCILSELQ